MNIERTDVSERTIQAIVDTEIACSPRSRRERDCGLGRKEAMAVGNDDIICHVGDVNCHWKKVFRHQFAISRHS